MWRKPNWVSVPSPTVMAQQELQEAKLELLKAQTGRDYAAAMVQYHTDRITRLTAFIDEQPFVLEVGT